MIRRRVEFKIWDMLHNVEGPAVIEYDQTGRIVTELYYMEDVLLDKDTWNQIKNIDPMDFPHNWNRYLKLLGKRA